MKIIEHDINDECEMCNTHEPGAYIVLNGLGVGVYLNGTDELHIWADEVHDDHIEMVTSDMNNIYFDVYENFEDIRKQQMQVLTDLARKVGVI